MTQIASPFYNTIMANLKINEYRNCFINPSVQLNTSVTQVMNESIKLPVNEQLLFTSDNVDDYTPLNENTMPYRIFKDDDPLTYRTFDPKAIKAAKDANDQTNQSATNADNINPVINK